jgi:mRNA interferase MazF
MTRTPNSEPFQQFDVVVVPFPYSDRFAEKRRPALIISNASLHKQGLVWVAMITSANNESWSSDVPVTNLERAGLPAPSLVRTAKIACLDPSRILRRAGSLDTRTARAVAERLQDFLESGTSSRKR